MSLATYVQVAEENHKPLSFKDLSLPISAFPRCVVFSCSGEKKTEYPDRVLLALINVKEKKVFASAAFTESRQESLLYREDWKQKDGAALLRRAVLTWQM